MLLVAVCAIGLYVNSHCGCSQAKAQLRAHEIVSSGFCVFLFLVGAYVVGRGFALSILLLHPY